MSRKRWISFFFVLVLNFLLFYRVHLTCVVKCLWVGRRLLTWPWMTNLTCFSTTTVLGHFLYRKIISMSPPMQLSKSSIFFISRRREILICTMCVRACVRAWVGACVRACVTQFSQRLLQLDIFCQRRVLMNFHALEYFLGFIHFELKLSE